MAKHRPLQPCISAAEYDAYSPDGAKITGTLEIQLGEKAIRHFVREDGAYIHEWGDDYRDYDPDTVHVAGNVVYVDTASLMWPEDALTYRDRGTSRVIRRGRSQAPIVLSDLNFALTLGYHAETLISEVISPTSQMPTWPAVKTIAQLDVAGEARLLERFVERMGLGPALAAFAAAELAQRNKLISHSAAVPAGVTA